MNVFYLSSDPIQAARFQCDRHLHTSLRDTLILLSSVVRSNREVEILFKKQISPSWFVDLLNPCESSDPWLLWAKESPAHFYWLASHASALANELTWRGLMPPMKKRASYEMQILTRNFIEFARFAMESNPCESKGLPPCVMPVEFRNLNLSPKTYNAVVNLYQTYYLAKMRQAADAGNYFVWTNRPIPWWLDADFIGEIPVLPPRIKVQSSIRPLDSISS